jgi:hypothetical protein
MDGRRAAAIGAAGAGLIARPAMVAVVVEREFEQPVSAADLHAGVKAGRWCLDLYRVRPSLHYLATDGSRCACVLEAPDAEAVRMAMRTLPTVPPKRVWPATIHPGPGNGEDGLPAIAGSRVVAAVERSLAEPVDPDGVHDLAAQGACCRDLHQVRCLRSYLSLDRHRMLCLYEAPDVEAVRIVYRRAGLRFDSVWGAGVWQPSP